jgi:cytosine/adenosine deaminase-related metal-dependent hydrolase
MFLRARIVLPVSKTPIENGAVWIRGPSIVWVGRWTEAPPEQREQVVDLGDVILLPGLINAHCHLDYTNMAGQIAPPRGFTQWIQGMVALKAAWTPAEFARSWRRGAEMLVQTGTTTVADVEAAPEQLPDFWPTSPLRVISFRELIRLQSGAAAREAVESAVADWGGIADSERPLGLSPHAPYTTTRDLLEAAAAAAERHRWHLTTHVAESEEEFEMFMYRHGPMFDWLKSQREMTDCGLGSPVQHLERCGYLDVNLLAVHANYLWRHDAAILARNEVSVVHCPRSHDYFGHLKFPFEDLADAGVNLCLGTDSLATVRRIAGEPLKLNLFTEMQSFASSTPMVAPGEILKMVTVNAARALGQSGRIGELTEHAYADLIALDFKGQLEQVSEAIVQHSGDVRASMIRGEWAVPPPSLARADV